MPAILNEARAVEAPHTSRTAEYAPKCKPGSRALVIQDILDCLATIEEEDEVGRGGRGRRRRGGGRDIRDDGADDATPIKSILWFHGPAGGGKTCIMREVSTRLQRLGRLAGSYFFSSRVGGLDSERPFVATIAHQLAILCPYYKAELLRAISAHPTVFEESLNSQVEKLIHEPLESSAKMSTDSLSGRWLTLVVDGFDECHNSVERSNLLCIFHGLATATGSVRFFLIMASRSELDIRQAFDHQPLDTTMEHRMFAISFATNFVG
ncbi:hypothetical protein FA13DRAFT_1670464 [Coprinellus micaceus]|uniref:Nephrocystin 3-like N-terminal domain-containing protein n=1 Tax=Coprinellus micaceus TaxID=71717 RepID=A0A4Y7SMJ5_COPMI|nr:hypothetical protein FA13DRAFT_1670464 [Coprinellus micaceus]